MKLTKEDVEAEQIIAQHDLKIAIEAYGIGHEKVATQQAYVLAYQWVLDHWESGVLHDD